MLLTEAVRETAIYLIISCKPEVMATKNTHLDEVQGMAIHVTEEAVFRRKPDTEILHQVKLPETAWQLINDDLTLLRDDECHQKHIAMCVA
ncbi:hypothetical protein DPMN_097265 [Dreissena polymorpha]|uniref:Uncharacterized protein n=1 Tax=Dreissena polymorpha TaxID=45954 RepID=A0A9D4R4F6_DREPO|nr:hypothetical protein DPMN_097265 [Dreissena polymorpha]